MRFAHSTYGLIVTVAALAALPGQGAAGQTLRVDDDASPGGDGSDWSTAYKYLRDAIQAAAASGGTITEIRVAQGTYRPDEDEANPAGSGIRQVSFGLLDGVALRGGYVGLDDPDNADVRDPAVHVTVLSGDLDEDDGPDFANNGENSIHVLTAAMGATSATLDGFTITAGHANGVPPAAQSGGGLRIDAGAAVEIVECRFITNAAAEDGGAVLVLDAEVVVTGCDFEGNASGDDGAAIFNVVGSCLTLTDCDFEGNVAQSSGGGVQNDDATCIVTGGAFLGCMASSHQGGGFRNTNGGQASIIGCLFQENSAGENGGAVHNNLQATIDLNGCTFMLNEAGTNGGAVHNAGGGITTVSRGLFDGNTANSGGAIASVGGSLTVSGSTFDGNVSATFGGAMSVTGGGAPRLVDSMFTGNAATLQGGGLYNGAALGLGNCTFNGNTAPSGTGIFNDGTIYGETGGVLGKDGFVNAGVVAPAVMGMEGSVETFEIGLSLVQFVPGVPERPAGVIVADIQAVDAYDAVHFPDGVTLSGGLRLEIADYSPAADCFDIVTGSMIDGAIDVVYVPHQLTDFLVGVTADRCGAGQPLGPGGISVGFSSVSMPISFSTIPPLGFDGTPRAITVGDFDGDLNLDLAIALNVTLLQGTGGRVRILLGDGNGDFTTNDTDQLIAVGNNPSAIETADLDDDLDLDLAVTSEDDGALSILINEIGNPGACGGELFCESAFPIVTVDTDQTLPSDLALVNVDPAAGGDTDIDVVVSLVGVDASFDGFAVLTNDGAANFAGPATPTDLGGSATSIAAGDFAGDGNADIAVTVDDGTGEPGVAMAIIGDGSGGFDSANPVTRGVELTPTTIDPECFDDNKDADLVVLNGGSSSASVILNDGTELSASISLSLGGTPVDVATLDLESDGDNDMAIIVDTVVQLVRNDLGDGSRVVFVLDDAIAVDGVPVLIAAGDVDNDGHDDLIVISTPAAAAAPGPATMLIGVHTNDASDTCPEDTNGDGEIDVTDLVGVILCWSTDGMDCPDPGDDTDVNGDGTVDVIDLVELVLSWGPCP